MPPVRPSRIRFAFKVIGPCTPCVKGRRRRKILIHMPISDWPAEERPRERLLAQGAAALSDAELLAIVLRTGVRGKSAVELGRELLARFRSLAGILGADLAGVKGLGPAKRAQFAAALELARRSVSQQLKADTLNSPGAVRDYLRLAIS